MWRRNSVPSVWGLEHSMWARCMEGVRNATAHCSRTAGSHSWLRTNTARLPTFWSNHSASRWRAGLHSWDSAEQAQRWGVVFSCAPQSRHVVSNTVLRWTIYAPGQSSLGCCPCGAPIYGAAGHCPTSQGGGHSPSCSSPPNEPHIRPAPEWRLDPGTSHSGLWGKARTGPGRLRGEEGEGAAEEPCEVYLRWLLRRRIHTDVEARDPLRRRGDRIYGRG